MMTSFYNRRHRRSLPTKFRHAAAGQQPLTGRSVLVTIRDRGPFVRGRALDISRAYAQRLGFAGAGVARAGSGCTERYSAPFAPRRT